MKQAIRNVVMIDNFDSFTYNLVDYLKQTGVRVTVFRNTTPVKAIERASPDLLVFSPGPGNPSQAGHLLQYIRFFSKRVPQFGVCLGLQAMVEAFGGSLRILKRPYHGKASLVKHTGEGIFQNIPNPVAVGRYHSLAVATMPENFTVTATTTDPENGEVVMAIKHTTLPLQAVQFHPESILTAKHQAGLQMIRNLIDQL